MKKDLTIKKITGATFTPQPLADFLSARILKYCDVSNNISILDPACGDGILLSSFVKNFSDIRIKVFGYDTNQQYINSINQKFFSLNISEYEFINDDFLTICPNNIDLFNDKAKREFCDIIIANPPYVRTQTLGSEKSQELSKNFGIKGKIDLYYPFFMAITNALKVGGILGIITSNRYICTKSGSDIRKFLIENYDIIEIIDLGDTKLFDAAVLPAIFIGKKKKKNSSNHYSPIYRSIYENNLSKDSYIKTYSNIFDILKSDIPGIYKTDKSIYEYRFGKLKQSSDKSDIWQLADCNNSIVDTMEENSPFKIKDKFKVRVGIKSCADDIFITQKWENMGINIEADLLKPMLSQENIDTWHIESNDIIEILYPHYSAEGKRMVFNIEDYPNAYKYLNLHRQQLEKRTYLIKANRNWYEYWVPQNPSLWSYPKIVFPDISIKPRFCLDKSGAVVNGNCYWICAQNKEEEELLLLIEGVCNSSIMTKYHDSKFTNKLYSGRRRYLSQYIEEYPLPNPNCEESKKIIQLTEKINQCFDSTELISLTTELDKWVEKAYGIIQD